MDATKSGEKDDAEASHVPVPGSIVPDIVNNRVAIMIYDD
jgi:hypothetical protein